MGKSKPMAKPVELERYSFHLARDLKLAAQSIAIDTGRTTSNTINMLIREAIQYRKVKI